jgi:hypothetical protein
VKKEKIKMIKLKLNEEKVEPRKGFWRRQFQTESTESQKTFDWLFGVILPVVCFVFDPIVFKGDAWGAAYLGTYKPFAYILSFVSVMAMSAWLIWGEKLKWLNAFLAGLFIVGGIVSLSLGIILLPISLLGLFILIGALGFTPMFSAVVYLRNSLRAYQAAKPSLEKSVLTRSFALSAIFSAVVPSVINAEINRALDKIIKGDARTVRAEIQSLKYIAPLINFDVLALHYHRSALEERETEKMKAIAAIYKEMTGENLERKVRVLMD